MKESHFKLSSSFQSHFAPAASQPPAKKTTDLQQTQSFHLNPTIADPILNVPVDTLRRKSRQKLESLKDQQTINKFSILNPRPEVETTTKDKKKQGPKKYRLQTSQEAKLSTGEQKKQVQQLPADIVRHSNLPEIEPIQMGQATLFQTPVLPCFASEFSAGSRSGDFKGIQEKAGVWKIGKIKIKGKQAKLQIGGFQFEASLAQIEGKAGAVDQANFYELPNWQGAWVVQPVEQLFQ